MIIVSAEYGRNFGLGNKLFPWARAKILSARLQIPMIETMWFSPHGGGVTRGGVDYANALRKVWLLGNFCKARDEISLIKYALKYRNYPIQRCLRLADGVESVKDNQGDSHILFSALGRPDTGHDFLDFEGESLFLREKLYEIARPSQKAVIDQYHWQRFIGINVRCGNDFVSRESGKKGFVKTGLSWFVGALETIRREYGNMPAIVVSDGGPRQLEVLLREADVHLLNAHTAIADLLILSKAQVLLGSGNSSFSAWASFLGEMDTFTSKDTPFFHVKGLSCGRNGKKIVGLI